MKRIRAVGQELLNTLKSKTILERKPNLKICSNHRKTIIGGGRVWNPLTNGQAFSDGRGWYQPTNPTPIPVGGVAKPKTTRLKNHDNKRTIRTKAEEKA